MCAYTRCCCIFITVRNGRHSGCDDAFWWGRWCGRTFCPEEIETWANFDWVFGFDLATEEHQREVPRRISVHKPLVVIMVAPCTFVGHWAHLSRAIHLETWQQSRRIGEILATFAASVCELQMKCHRHFLVENPAGSGIFSLSCCRALWDTGGLVSINVPHCALGPNVGGQPTYKNTAIFASSVSLLKQFEGVQCNHRSHGALMGRWGSETRTKFAQVWPRDMCPRVCIGMQSLLRRSRLV